MSIVRAREREKRELKIQIEGERNIEREGEKRERRELNIYIYILYVNTKWIRRKRIFLTIRDHFRKRRKREKKLDSCYAKKDNINI